MAGLTRSGAVGEAQRREGGKPDAASGNASVRTGNFGEFEILREVGRGGMGVVYLARDRRSKRQVALKVMLPGQDAGGEREFVREAAIAARLHHPSVVGIHEIGSYRGVLYFTMDYVEGTTLDAHFRAENPSLNERLRIFLRICEAVGHAHSRGVLHLDLKPQNILVNRRGEASLTDFGLARLVDDRPTLAERRRNASGEEEETIVGTPWYMSPEHIQGRVGELDGRSDVFALGVLLFKLLTDQLPFDGKDYMEVLTNIQFQSPRAMEGGALRVPPALELITLTALKKRKEHRYQTVADFAGAVRNYLAGQSAFRLRRKVACL